MILPSFYSREIFRNMKYSGIYLIFIVALSIFFIVPPHFSIGDVSLLEIDTRRQIEIVDERTND